MSKTIIPANYTPALNLYDTQRAIGTVKRLFADTLCATLNLYRVSAPLFLEASTGLNDDLNGVERKVTFDIKDSGTEAQVVQSLAKWKRKALKDYGFRVGKGLYCDMNAIRRDEELDNLHSVYVDQWDWEKVIREEDRNEAYLKNVVRSIVSAVCATEMNLHAMFPQLQDLPLHTPNVTFITTQELEDLYPDLTPKERENPDIINPSRKRRIAAGSGQKVEDVNRLLNQHKQMQKLFKQFNGKGSKKKMRRMGFDPSKLGM